MLSNSEKLTRFALENIQTPIHPCNTVETTLKLFTSQEAIKHANIKRK